ncbi:hypothetical protein B0H34DRAFT_796576 [Crassisporium funariophilum]|nr:hypothetical protein B0H34DRAFT_796576 [Crassisporium funariophilum]
MASSMINDRVEESSRNDSIRTLAVFFAATAIGLLSFTHDIYSNRESSSGAAKRLVSDDVTDAWLLLAMLFALSVAALRRPGGNTRISDFVLTLAFYALLIGTMVFVWANWRKAVAIIFTTVLGMLAVAYVSVIDPSPSQDEDDWRNRIGRYFEKYRGLSAQPTMYPHRRPMSHSDTANGGTYTGHANPSDTSFGNGLRGSLTDNTPQPG